jgi:hypothetical protein
VSVTPCSTIEHSTVSAARLKIRSPCGTPALSTSSEKVIVATPLGPNHAMKAFSARSTRVPASATHTAIVRATSNVTAATPMAA